MNFKKKLQAINNTLIHSDDKNDEYPDRRPEMKKLFSVLRNATRDEINQVTRLVETFKGY